MGFFLKGCVLGLSIAAPVGPIGLLCIRRTLTHGRVAGFVSGLGAATADFAYACIAAFGISAAVSNFFGAEHAVRIIGAVFLLYLGVKTFFDKPAEAAATAPASTLVRCFST